MKCEHVRELMSAYIDNEINEVDKAKLEKHIAQCPQCKEEYELLKELVLECSEIDEVELPEDFREELHNKLIEAKNNKPSKVADFMRKNKWKAATGAVAAVLIFAISLNALGLGAQKNTNDTQSSLPEGARSSTPYGIASAGGADQGNMGIASAGDIAPQAPAPTVAPADMAKGKADTTITFGESTDKQESISNTTSLMLTADQVQPESKIIKNGNVSLKVTRVEDRVKEIEELAAQNGGRVDSSYIDNINQPPVVPLQEKEAQAKAEETMQIANMTIRVPADKFEAVFQRIGAMGKLVNKSTSTNDVTYQYTDIQARVDNLKVQEKNLQDIMSKATNVTDTLKVETELNRVRTEIDVLTRDLKSWDQQVAYSTIYINMTEVKEAELEKVDVPGTWQKAYNGLINTINNLQKGIEWLFVSLVSVLPYLLMLGVGSLLAVLWIKSRNKKSE